MQAVLSACAGVLFASLLMIERSVLLAQPYAEIWAPMLARVAAMPQDAATLPAIERRAMPPQGPSLRVPNRPGPLALRKALAQRGVHVDDFLIEVSAGEPRVWLRVLPPRLPPVWLGISEPLLLPQWSWRLTVGSVFVVLLVAALSWAVARRLARPLEQLRTHIQAHAPGRRDAGPATADPAATVGASVEIAAISRAYTDLLARSIATSESAPSCLVACRTICAV
ncbi:MAG: hypothetical protein H0W38_15400, partial [Methylibium sp.]|nr:hypothetical protein [Methylibium sp.]